MAWKPLLLCLVGLLPQSIPSAKQIFKLEIPEANLSVPQNQSVSVPHPFLTRLRVRVKGTPQRFAYGQIVTRVNGESANVIMTTGSDRDGIYCDLDLNFRAGFRLNPGRNSVEVQAEDYYGRSYFGSFAIFVGDQARSANEIRTRVYPGPRGSSIPRIQLLQPYEPLSDAVRNVTFQGLVLHDNHSLTLNIGGQDVELEPVDGGVRGGMIGAKPGQVQFRFQSSVRIEPEVTEVRVVIRDIVGSRAEVVVPVFPTAPASVRRRFAVVIGISNYKDERLRLKYAHSDALAFRDLLIDEFGFLRSNILTLVDEGATAQQIRYGLFSFLARVEETDQVVVFFAGHGMRDPNNPIDLYLLPYDTDPEHMASTALPMWRMDDLFSRTLKSSNVFTFVDACHSAGIGVQEAHNLINQYVSARASKEGRSVLVASDIGQYAEESNALRGGVFTHFLIRGLRGEADANGDRRLTTDEIFSFVRTATSAFTDGRQVPVSLAGSHHHQPLFEAAPHRGSKKSGKK